MKEFGTAVILGRFQLFHNGHLSLIDDALNKANKVVVLVGSANKSRTKTNPFTFEERKEMIKSVRNNVEVIALDDLGVGDVFLWGDYLVEKLNEFGYTPNLFIFGNEAKIDKWFRKSILDKVTIEKVDRSLIDISATKLREYILNDNKEYLKYIPNELQSNIDKYKSILESIEK